MCLLPRNLSSTLLVFHRTCNAIIHNNLVNVYHPQAQRHHAIALNQCQIQFFKVFRFCSTRGVVSYSPMKHSRSLALL
ncbi:hypothetical protein BJ912DRAFT_673377 [Pholiota molesta]|nr:hypothetical protein BJ912DRAFT_673377 [Pholiota molesta]